MKVQKEHKTELTIEAQDLEVIAGLMMSQCVSAPALPTSTFLGKQYSKSLCRKLFNELSAGQLLHHATLTL